MTRACPATSIRSQSNIGYHTVPYLVPHIKVLFDNVMIKLQYQMYLFDIEENTFNFGPDIQIYPSLPLNIRLDIKGFLPN